MQAQFEDEILSHSQVFDLTKKVCSGRDEVQSLGHTRRPRANVTDDNIKADSDLFEVDRCLTVKEIASKVGLSIWSIHPIISKHLGLKKATTLPRHRVRTRKTSVTA